LAWGGARKGAGRKAKAPSAADPAPPSVEPTAAVDLDPLPPALSDKSAAEILDDVARRLYACGNLVEASKAAARAEAARARAAAASQTPGKRQQRQDAAERASSGRFAPPPPPGPRPN
jgi:hypothetical protein